MQPNLQLWQLWTKVHGPDLKGEDSVAAYDVRLSCQATLDLWDLLQVLCETVLPCAIIPVCSRMPHDFYLDRPYCISSRHNLVLLWRNSSFLFCLSSPQYLLLYFFHFWTNQSMLHSADLLFHYRISMLSFQPGMFWSQGTSITSWLYHRWHTLKHLALNLMVFSLPK